MDEPHSQLIALRTCVSGPSLFCMHDGIFRQMAAHLPATMSIYELRPMNLNAAATDMTIERLAAGHVRNVLEAQKRGPYHLIGYSFGGLVAYEMAAVLESHGHDIAFLGLIDTPHPRFTMNLSDAELAAARKKYVADRRRKYWGNFRAARFDRLAVDAGKLARSISRRLKWRVVIALEGRTALERSHLSIAHRINLMWHAYVPRTLAGRLVLFRAEGRGAEFGDDATMGWHHSVPNGVDVQFVRGTHEAMLETPNAEHLARQLLPYFAIEPS